MNKKLPNTIMIAGPALTGKSTIARQLEARFSYFFIEGDHLHPLANIDKMSRGVPLTDEDRFPWLRIVANEIVANTETHTRVVATCSALQPRYRDIIRQHCPEIFFVFLTASFETLYSRAVARGKSTMHFFNAAKNPQLLRDQIKNAVPPLNEPNSLVIDLDKIAEHEDKEAVFKAIAAHLNLDLTPTAQAT